MEEKETVFVKEDTSNESLYNFMGMHLLARNGVHIAPILFATQSRLVAKEVKGTLLKSIPKDREHREYYDKYKTYADLVYKIMLGLIER